VEPEQVHFHCTAIIMRLLLCAAAVRSFALSFIPLPMPEPPEPNPTPQPLVMRSYRRHRKQSRWGTYSFIAPPIAILWVVFWYLMSNRPKIGRETSAAISMEAMAMMIGCAAISLVGVALATAGMLDGYYKHGRAAVGLAVNMVVLVGVGILFFLRVFSQSVG